MEAVGQGRNALASGADPFCPRHHHGDALKFTASVCLRGIQSFPVSGSFQMSHFSTSGGQSIGVSASASILPMNIQD